MSQPAAQHASTVSPSASSREKFLQQLSSLYHDALGSLAATRWIISFYMQHRRRYSIVAEDDYSEESSTASSATTATTLDELNRQYKKLDANWQHLERSVVPQLWKTLGKWDATLRDHILTSSSPSDDYQMINPLIENFWKRIGSCVDQWDALSTFVSSEAHQQHTMAAALQSKKSSSQSDETAQTVAQESRILISKLLTYLLQHRPQQQHDTAVRSLSASRDAMLLLRRARSALLEDKDPSTRVIRNWINTDSHWTKAVPRVLQSAQQQPTQQARDVRAMLLGTADQNAVQELSEEEWAQQIQEQVIRNDLCAKHRFQSVNEQLGDSRTSHKATASLLRELWIPSNLLLLIGSTNSEQQLQMQRQLSELALRMEYHASDLLFQFHLDDLLVLDQLGKAQAILSKLQQCFEAITRSPDALVSLMT